MYIIRGKIEKADGGVSITCCTTVEDVFIDGKSLYYIIDKYLGLDVYDEDSSREPELLDIKLGLSYLILKEDPGFINDYNGFIGEWVMKKLYTEYIYGCYSEMTCGSGGHEYFLGEGDNGHNIYQELSSYVGDYVILRIDDHRDIIIDSILNEG